MIDFRDLLAADAVVEGIEPANKKALLQQLGSVAAAAYALDAKAVTAALAAREKLGSTGFGAGIALPHARLAGLDRAVALFARLADPIDFEAIDSLPVDLVAVLLSPVDPGATHLKALARLSRRLRDQDFVAKLRGAGSRDALYALWTADEARDAA